MKIPNNVRTCRKLLTRLAYRKIRLEELKSVTTSEEVISFEESIINDLKIQYKNRISLLMKLIGFN